MKSACRREALYPGCPRISRKERRMSANLLATPIALEGGRFATTLGNMASTNPSPDLSGTSIEWKTIEEAHERIRPRIHRTPVMTSESLNAMSGRGNCSFKCEKPAKRRDRSRYAGATNAIFFLERRRGFTWRGKRIRAGIHAAGGGRERRHGRGIPAWIVMPKNAPVVKCPRGGILWREDYVFASRRFPRGRKTGEAHPDGNWRGNDSPVRR